MCTIFKTIITHIKTIIIISIEYFHSIKSSRRVVSTYPYVFDKIIIKQFLFVKSCA